MQKVVYLNKRTGARRTAFKNPRLTVAIKFLDPVLAEEVRWEAQRAVQNAASFRALRGMKDALARKGGVHDFTINAGRVAKFVRDIKRLIVKGRVLVHVNGHLMQFEVRRAA